MYALAGNSRNALTPCGNVTPELATARVTETKATTANTAAAAVIPIASRFQGLTTPVGPSSAAAPC